MGYGMYDRTSTKRYPTEFKKPKQSLNVITKMNKLNYELANFYHGCLFSPTICAIQQSNSNNR